LVKKINPDVELHVSTQANVTSAATCRAWYNLGARRVVLARELTLDEIKAIRLNVPEDLELECFIHGSMCVSFSGRCLLSGHMIDRDANRGMCAQPCRWNYRIYGYEIEEEKRPECRMPVEEINGETFIMSSRDTCMIEHIPELVEAGIDSFKIEGRMKSQYYAAAVTNAYKIALDSYFDGNYTYDPLWLSELESVTHRDYATGYYFSDPRNNANLASAAGYHKEKSFIAVAEGYDSTTGLAEFTQRNKMKLGDEVEILSPGKIGSPIRIEALYDSDMQPIESVPHPYMRFFARTDTIVKAGDILRYR